MFHVDTYVFFYSSLLCHFCRWRPQSKRTDPETETNVRGEAAEVGPSCKYSTSIWPANCQSPSVPKVGALGPSQLLKPHLCCPEWVEVADIPGCLESWPGEPGLGKCQPDAGAPDPEEEAAGGGKEASLAHSLLLDWKDSMSDSG